MDQEHLQRDRDGDDALETDLDVAAPPGRAPLTRDLRTQRTARRNGGEALPEGVRGRLESSLGVGLAPDVLPSSTMARMESGLGGSFSDVSIVPESRATGSADALTTGDAVHFAPGKFEPGTERGDWLLAHELAHVQQQRIGSAEAVQPFDGRAARGLLEREADQAADAVVSGGRAEVQMGAAAGTVQRFEAYEHADLGDLGETEGDPMRVQVGNPPRWVTYGELVALSGDFYESSNELMNADGGELSRITDVMAYERAEARTGHVDVYDHRRALAGEDPTVSVAGAPSDATTINLLFHGARPGGGHGNHPYGDEDHHEGHGHEGGGGSGWSMPWSGGSWHWPWESGGPAAGPGGPGGPGGPSGPVGPGGPTGPAGAPVAPGAPTNPVAPGSTGTAAPGAQGAPTEIDTGMRNPTEADLPPGARYETREDGHRVVHLADGQIIDVADPGVGSGSHDATGERDNADAGPGGGGTTGATDAGFLEAAAHNSSHFSPENIDVNFRRIHQLALDKAKEAYDKKPGLFPAVAAGAAAAPTPVAAAGTGAAATGQPGNAGADAAASASVARGRSAAAGARIGVDESADADAQAAQRLAAEAMVRSAFSVHFLTDAFASGHLVSGRHARNMAVTWWMNHLGQVQAAVRACLQVDQPQLYMAANTSGLLETGLRSVFGALNRSQYTGMLLKLVHDDYNQAGLMVRNPVGATWMTYGDGNMGRAPETRLQGQAAAAEARLRVMEVLHDGVMRPGNSENQDFGALRYVPDHVQPLFPAGAGFQEIHEFCSEGTSATVFPAEWDANALTADPASNRLYRMMKNNLVMLITLGDTRERPISAWGIRAAWEAYRGAQGVVNGVTDAARGVANAAGNFWNGTVAPAASAVGGFFSNAWNTASSAVSGAASTAAGWANEHVVQPGMAAASSAAGWVGDNVVNPAMGAASTAAGWANSNIVQPGMAAAGNAASWANSNVVQPGMAAAGNAASWANSNVVQPGLNAAGNAASWANDNVVQPGLNAGRRAAGWANDNVVQPGVGLARRGYDAASTAVGGAVDAAGGLLRRTAARVRDAVVPDWVQRMFRERAVRSSESERATGVRPGESRDTAVAGLGNQTYAHGAFMGASGRFLHDATWMQIYERLMPDSAARARAITDVASLEGFLENNPVLAAYGEAQSMSETSGGANAEANPDDTRPVRMEWDVWIDPTTPGDLNLARIAHGNGLTTAAAGVPGGIGPRISPLLTGREDIAGAPSASGWSGIFGRAIQMYRASRSAGGDAADPAVAARREAAWRSLLSPANGAAALQVCRDFFGRRDGGIILDVKSTYSTTQDIAAFIRGVEASGIHVFGVGSFRQDQLDGLGALVPGIETVRFFHGLSDLQRGLAALPDHQHVMFNAGDLLVQSVDETMNDAEPAGPIDASSERPAERRPRSTFGVDRARVQQLMAFQRQKHLVIGLYVQETAVHPRAIDAVTRMVNDRPELFELGFAHGNTVGHAEEGTEGTGVGAQSTLIDGNRVANGGDAPAPARRASGEDVTADPGAAFAGATSGAGAEVPFRADMERSFGQDFGGVRAHLGQSDAMRSIGAQAAAHGESVAFASEAPDKMTVAHELAHVVQHRNADGGPGPMMGRGGLSDPSSAAEVEAESVAHDVVAGHFVQVGATMGSDIHRRDPPAGVTAAAHTFSVPGVTAIARIPDPVNRNQAINTGYHAIDGAMTGYLGDPLVSNWFTFGQHASREAGTQIRNLQHGIAVLNSALPILAGLNSINPIEVYNAAREAVRTIQRVIDLAQQDGLIRMAMQLAMAKAGVTMSDLTGLVTEAQTALERAPVAGILGPIAGAVVFLPFVARLLRIGGKFVAAIPAIIQSVQHVYDNMVQGNREIYENVAPAAAQFLAAAQGAPDHVPGPMAFARDERGFLSAAFAEYGEVRRLGDQARAEPGTPASAQKLALRAQKAAHANLVIGFQEQLVILQPIFDTMQQEMLAMSGTMVLHDPNGVHPLASNWGDFYTRMGIDPARAPADPSTINASNIPPLLPSTDPRLHGTIGEYFGDGLTDEKIHEAPPSIAPI